MLKGFLTKRPSGLYVISSLPPAIARVGKTDELDAYVTVGDGFGQHRVPPSMVRRVFGEELCNPLRTARIEMYGDRGIEIWISRRGPVFGFQCMMTEFEPAMAEIDGQPELWPQPGDGIYCDVFCTWFAESMWGSLESLETRKVLFSGKVF